MKRPRRQVAATVMLGIIGRACASIRNEATINLLEPEGRFWLSRDSLITLEALTEVANTRNARFLAGLMGQLRDAAVTASCSSEAGWLFRCGACAIEGDQQTFEHAVTCPAVLWDWHTGVRS